MLARRLVQQPRRIIIGGGKVGLMGVVAEAAPSAGGYLVRLLDQTAARGFLLPAYRKMLAVDADAQTLLAKMGVPGNA